MANASDWVTRRLDNALDLLAVGERARIAKHARFPGPDRVAQARGAITLTGPADAGERGARLADIEISDADHVKSRNSLGLRQNHGAEFPGPDQADPNRLPASRPLLEHG
jgi:hypothetical protein